jgi:hypothetical protein
VEKPPIVATRWRAAPFDRARASPIRVREVPVGAMHVEAHIERCAELTW